MILHDVTTDLVQCLAIVPEAFVDLLQVVVDCIERLLDRILKFGEGDGSTCLTWCAIGLVYVGARNMEAVRAKWRQTRGDTIPSFH